jgi:thiol-disulfide isomerase/thioredoxin
MKIVNRIVMTLAGLLLIAASALKAQQMLTEPIVSKGLWESWHFFLVAVPLEMALGIWLVSGLFRKAAWLFGVLSFGFFIGVTAYKAAAGELSCGCFGKMSVNPWITLLAIDVPLFLLLLIFFPRGEKLLPPPWPHPFHCLAVAIPASLFLGALVPTLFFNKPPDRSEKYVVIKPGNWQVNPQPGLNQAPIVVDANKEPNLPVPVGGKQGPVEPNLPAQQTSAGPNEADLPDWQLMLNHVDIADQLRTGVKIVLFYHYDCPDCTVAIPLYSEYSKQLSADEHIRFAFIKGPPYGPDEADPVPAGTTALVGKLDRSRDWIFESPLIFLLKDGRLVKWWQVEYPDFDQLLQTILTTE